jgi:phenylalanyl-tRNA synthetase beta chain
MTAEGWMIQPPSWRYDIAIEQDLIEEVARVYGYNRLPSRSIKAES